jgi:hypothetical protein
MNMEKTVSQMQREWFERYQIAKAIEAAKADNR